MENDISAVYEEILSIITIFMLENHNHKKLTREQHLIDYDKGYQKSGALNKIKDSKKKALSNKNDNDANQIQCAQSSDGNDQSVLLY